MVIFQKPLTTEVNFLVAFKPIAYIKESKVELTKIIWPTRQETLKFTLIVIFASVVIGAYIAGLDFTLTSVAEKFLYK